MEEIEETQQAQTKKKPPKGKKSNQKPKAGAEDENLGK